MVLEPNEPATPVRRVADAALAAGGVSRERAGAADPAPGGAGGDRDRWNDRHAKAIAEGRADRPPADWIFEHASVFAAQPRGRVLDVAGGRGRNALYLAAMGFEVDTLDISDVAISYLRERAVERGLPIHARVADLSTEPLPPGPYEVVLNTFFLDRALFPALRAALAPGGLLAVVTFLSHERDKDHRWHALPGELREAFAGLDIIDYREGPALPGDRPRASLLARARN